MSSIRLLLLLWLGAAGAGAGSPGTADVEAGKLRKQLVAFHERQDPGAVETAWPHLDSPDRAIREAARLAIEAQAFDTWRQRALGETRTWAALEALLALVRACPPAQAEELRPHVCEGISTLRIEGMSEEQQLAAVRLTRLACTRLGPPSADERSQMTDLWTRFLPPENAVAKVSPILAREIRELLKLLAPVEDQKP